MDFFKELFGVKDSEASPFEQANTLLERFTTATLAGVDAEDIGRYPLKQHKVMAFHFGVIEYLGNQYELDETQTLALFVKFLYKYFNMPISETGSISERLEGFRNNPEELNFLEAGIDVFRRWHEQNERRAPLELGEMLKS